MATSKVVNMTGSAAISRIPEVNTIKVAGVIEAVSIAAKMADHRA